MILHTLLDGNDCRYKPESIIASKAVLVNSEYTRTIFTFGVYCTYCVCTRVCIQMQFQTAVVNIVAIADFFRFMYTRIL